MLDALAHRKAHRLMDKAADDLFPARRRPQEDLMTSSVFGIIRLLPQGDQYRALGLLLGEEAERAFQFDPRHPLRIRLWERFTGLEDRLLVEPDLLLSSGPATVVVEVKWHAVLSQCQVEQQVKAVTQAGEAVTAAVILGQTDSPTRVEGIPVFHRAWREASAALHNGRGVLSDPLRQWAGMVGAALQATALGHSFAGLRAPVGPAVRGRPFWSLRSVTIHLLLAKRRSVG
jgi:hypothetical protein